MHRVFVSYYHYEDQYYKTALDNINYLNDIYQDCSVRIGDIDDDNLDDQQIRRIIRDDYLTDSSVTVLLCGRNTAGRKHVDWELYSSMYDGQVNKKSGVLVVNLPSIENGNFYAGHGLEEKQLVYPGTTGWVGVTDKADYQKRYPSAPERIIDSLVAGASISIVNWSTIQSDPDKLRYLIDVTYNDRKTCTYDLSAPMRRRNS